MRRVNRPALPNRAQAYLSGRQAVADQRRALGRLDLEREWNSARRTQAVGAVLKSLQEMMGPRQRCMYCVDSHGSDIDHFRPKARYPGRAFEWSNMLLCCTECGRFKGSRFPMSGRRPLLIDPTAEDPWQHLDFDPDTGNLTARFDLHANDWSAKGVQTVEVLRLDRREAMAAGYLRTYRRLARVVQDALPPLRDGTMESTVLLDTLQEADDHGLLAWCLSGAGQAFLPFTELRDRHPDAWARCVAATQ